uniref:Reverse transcriptase domain-containing protein n=1 Tax=Tanacetum cinerariifolium TaxID=118510 RepID=A0A6L2L5R0_TANCI|nr:reverse transcriptase domain-containing protein [Tanacetum cinerariifolium]
MMRKFLLKYFPSSMVTKLRNEITKFRQDPNESLFEAWERYKLSIDRCPNHNMLLVTQIDTFYNGLTLRHRDTINAAAGGTFMQKTPEECYKLIENMTAHHNHWDTLATRDETSRNISSTTTTEMNTTCKTCVGPHSYTECPAVDGYTQEAAYATTANPRGDVKAITTQSGVSYDGPTIPPTPSPLPKVVERETEAIKDKVQATSSESTAHVQPSVVQVPIMEPELRDALLHIPNFASTFKSLLSNKEKLFKLSSTPLNENYSVVLLKNLPEKLGDPDKFLFPCDFSELEECLTLADLGASINLMPFSEWNKLSRLSSLQTDRTTRALIDVHDEELTLRVNDEAITFKFGHTLRYFRNYNEESVNRIDVIDISCEEYAQEVLGFSNSLTRGNPTPSDPIIASSSPSFTPFKGSDFILEEIKTFLHTSNELTNLDDDYYDTEGDILYLEKLLNEVPSPNLPPMKNEDLSKLMLL